MRLGRLLQRLRDRFGALRPRGVEDAENGLPLRRGRPRDWRGVAERELSDELAHHVERRARVLMRRGLAPDAARTEAIRRLGDVQRIEEECMRIAERRRVRDRIRGVVDDVRRDSVSALRSLARQPLFAGAVILTTGLGVGAATSVFGLVNGVLLRPLPYGEQDRVVRIYNQWDGEPTAAFSPAEFFDYEAGTQDVFASLGVYRQRSVNVTGAAGEPERVQGAHVSHGVLDALGIAPPLGRLFGEGDDDPGAAPVAVLGHGYWQRAFGGAADVVGRTIVVNGVTTPIVGVLPRGFELPDGFAPDDGVDVYLPLWLDPALVTERGSHFLSAVARLAEGVPPERAQASIAAVAARFVREFPDDYPRDMRFGVHLVPISDDVVGDVRGVMLMLLAAVGFLVLIACANVSGLMLTRMDTRQRELALRAALGAGRLRIARMLLVESLVLALIGGVMGLGIAAVWTRAVVRLEPPGIPRLDAVAMDPAVLLFALALAALSGAAFALGPLLTTKPAAATVALHGSSLRATSGRTSQRLRSGLIVAELAIAVVLLAGAGSLARGFVALLTVDAGYDTEDVLVTRISLPTGEYQTDEQRRVFWAELVRRASALPGIDAAGAVTNLPLASNLGDLNIRIEGREMREGDVSPRNDWQVITPDYFDAIGMRVIRGRGITDRDDERAAGAVVLNESAARLHFPDGDAIGKRFLLGGDAGPGWVTVVGIVNDVRHATFGAPPTPQMYLAHRQFRFWNGGSAVTTMSLVMRTRTDPGRLVSPVRGEIAALDSDLPPGTFQTMDAVASQSLSRPRFALTVVAGFALLALVLAAVGTHGVIAYATSRRAREMGIRIALGAGRTQVLALVLKQATTLVGLGAALGIAGAAVTTRALTRLLDGIEPAGPATLIAVTALLGIVSLIACALPARRATRVDPAETLRSEG